MRLKNAMNEFEPQIIRVGCTRQCDKCRAGLVAAPNVTYSHGHFFFCCLANQYDIALGTLPTLNKHSFQAKSI